MKMRVLIFENDQVASRQIATLVHRMGHEAVVFDTPASCPVFRFRECICPQQHPCADVVIIEQGMPRMSGIDFLTLQRKRGCKAIPQNKLLINSQLTDLQRMALKLLNVHAMQKPLCLSELEEWLMACQGRLIEGRQLADVNQTALI